VPGGPRRVALLLLWLLLLALPAAAQLEGPASTIPVVGPIIAAIGAILLFLRGSGAKAIEALANVVRGLHGVAFAGFGRILDAIKWLAKGGLYRLLKDFVRWIQVLRDRLARVLGPLVKIIRAYRDYFDAIFTKYVLPVLNLLQRIRQILFIFRTLHLKFAERLDRQILALQVKINEPFERIRQRLNGVINVLHLAMDPLGLYRIEQIIIGVGRTAAEIIAILQNARLAWPPPPPSPSLAPFHGYFTPARRAQRRALRAAGQRPPEEVEISRRIAAFTRRRGHG